MEFIPLEKYSKKTRSKKCLETVKVKTKDDEIVVKKAKVKAKPKPKPKPIAKVFEKKNVKNKYKEALASKQKGKVEKKSKKTKKNKNEKMEDVEKMELVVDQDEEDEEAEEEEEEEDGGVEGEKNVDEEAFKRKCREMDEKKKNRLFVKLKKKIMNEAQVKKLHPDIRSVIFPRKKKSRWCWAVFASEERANRAMKQMAKNKEILVSKPNPYERVDMKRKEKMKTVLRKKEAKKKLQKMWM